MCMNLWRQMQMRLAVSKAGRIVLHLLCFCGDGRLRWHAQGARRELAALLTLHDCLSLVGEMAGTGENKTVCAPRPA